MKKQKIRRYYYFDELRDDFANDGIESKPTPVDYRYLPKSAFVRFLMDFGYYFYIVLISPLLLVIRLRFRNVKVLRNRKDRKLGYFVYANHTAFLSDAVGTPIAAFPRKSYVICNPDAISIKGIGWLIKTLGALPTPSSVHTFRAYRDAIRTLCRKGHPIAIYPEAHIWPKYNGIRNFSDDSFLYPVELGAPCFVKTTVYKAKKNGKTKPTVCFDGPFYPSDTLPPREARKDLRDRVYAAMCLRAKNSVLDSRCEYIKVDSPSEVRTEIT